jgi:hypothetical protein
VGTVRDATTEVDIEIGRIRVPDTWGRLDTRSIAWTERFFPPMRRCDQMECGSSLWANFTANGGQLEPIGAEAWFSSPVRCRNSRIAAVPGLGLRQQMGVPPPMPPAAPS